MWDPSQYERFADERARPFHDLLARAPDLDVRTAVDLGCGSGGLTRRLCERWPAATVLGIDSSAEMLAKAAAGPRLSYAQEDIAAFAPAAPVDLLFSNAALHWLPQHDVLLPRLAAATSGALMLQMPDNFRAPSHRAVAEVLALPEFLPVLDGLQDRSGVKELSWYAEALLGLGFDVDAWATDYLHVLPGDDAVLQWLLGTTLRPHLQRLQDPALRQEFLRALAGRLAEHYPPRAGGTLFSFRRLFVVAVRR